METVDYFKAIVDTAQEGIMIVDPKGNILSMNPAAESLTGYTAAELVGRNCRTLDCTGCELIAPGEDNVWCKLFQDGEVKGKKCTITDKEHNIVHVSKNASVLRDKNGTIMGAVETLSDISEMVQQQNEILTLRKSLSMGGDYRGIIGNSAIMQHLYELIENVAQSDAPVMISGESGVGKELVARAIHESSPRQNGSFIKVNCAALNENLLESELFGHVKGAYTGAERNRIGRFEAAHRGSIFLDEIGDIPLPTQVKLLRVLEEKEIERVGDHKTIPVDVRIISASNKNLDELIEQGTFREDLYFRINVFPIHAPSLRDHSNDIPLLAQKFVEVSTEKSGKKVKGFTPEAMGALSNYRWPGNVRELRNTVEYALVLCSKKSIGKEHLPPKILGSGSESSSRTRGVESNSERDEIIRVLRKTGGNQSKAAEQLGISRVTVWKKIKKYNIQLSSEIH
jgi:two-component system, NtrC family, response regulator HydG